MRLIMTASQIEHFWAGVDKTADCWLWTRAKQTGGYGSLRVGDRTCTAHRVAYEIAYGEIPASTVIRHRCDHPLCVRPDHLLPGTHRDNVRDRIERGRTVQVRGEQISSAKLTAAQVRQIRTLAANGELSGRAIGLLFGISHTQVQYISSRRSWAHVDRVVSPCA